MKKIVAFLPQAMMGAAFAIFITGFFTALVNQNGEALISGFQAIFGGTLGTIDIPLIGSIDALAQFSFANLLAYMLPLLTAIVLFIVSYVLKKDNMLVMVIKVVIITSFIAAIIIFALLQKTTFYVIDSPFGATNPTAFDGATLGMGPIIGIIFASLGTLLGLADLIPSLKD